MKRYPVIDTRHEYKPNDSNAHVFTESFIKDLNGIAVPVYADMEDRHEFKIGTALLQAAILANGGFGLMADVTYNDQYRFMEDINLIAIPFFTNLHKTLNGLGTTATLSELAMTQHPCEKIPFDGNWRMYDKLVIGNKLDVISRDNIGVCEDIQKGWIELTSSKTGTPFRAQISQLVFSIYRQTIYINGVPVKETMEEIKKKIEEATK